MSWEAREYAQEQDARRGGGYGGSRLGALSVTTLIIIANIVVHVLLPPTTRGGIREMCMMNTVDVLHGQVWRIFTATYLHAGFNHIFFNMLGLYFFGPALERVWGRRQFFLVYTLGGVIGNLVLFLAGVVHVINPAISGLGASGSVLSLLGAAAVLFPNAKVFIYFLFPIRIRTFVALYGVWFVFNVMQKGPNFGGDLCHIGGLAVGLWWAWSSKHRTAVSPASLLGALLGRSREPSVGDGAWTRRVEQRRQDAEIIDRILRKVHENGIQSLTRAERLALEEASRRRREEEERLRRLDRD